MDKVAWIKVFGLVRSSIVFLPIIDVASIEDTLEGKEEEGKRKGMDGGGRRE